MISVWILVVMLAGDARGYGESNGAFIIDNIASLNECQRLQNVVQNLAQTGRKQAASKLQCVEVRKVK